MAQPFALCLANDLLPCISSPCDEDSRSLFACGDPRLLLVENDTTTCTLLTEALSANYRVESVSDGLAAWHVTQHQPPAWLLSGLYIKGADSLILIQSLRAGSQTAMLPIIVLTSSVDRDLMLRCLAAGANNFLLKPFAMSDLLACVQLELELHGSLAGSPGYAHHAT